MSGQRAQAKIIGIAGEYAFLCLKCKVFFAHIAQGGEFVRRECPRCGHRIITYQDSIITGCHE